MIKNQREKLNAITHPIFKISQLIADTLNCDLVKDSLKYVKNDLAQL